MHVPAGHLEFVAEIGRWSVRCRYCGLRVDYSPRPRVVMVFKLEEIGWRYCTFWAWKGWNCKNCVKREMKEEKE